MIVAPLIVGLLLVGGGQKAASPANGQPAPKTAAPSWQQAVTERIPLYGHRNWIVIADSAYPAQSSPGIETVVSSASQMEVVQAVPGADHHDEPDAAVYLRLPAARLRLLERRC